MSKISLIGIIVILIFLGVIFFVSGFLVAINLYGIGAVKPNAAEYTKSKFPDEIFSHQWANLETLTDIKPAYDYLGVYMNKNQRVPSNIPNNKPKNSDIYS